MKTLRSITLGFAALLALSVNVLADPFVGKVTDQDAGGGYLQVTSSADQTSKTFKVNDETVIVNADGTPSEMLKLIETTLVKVESTGQGNLATKITVIPQPANPNP